VKLHAFTMLTPLQLVAGMWLAAWPVLGGAGAPAARVPVAEGRPVAARSDERPASLLALDDEELLKLIQDDPAALGSLSIGRPGSGLLFNAVQMVSGPRWTIAPNADAWGTTETIEALQTAIDTVHELFPDTPPIYIGDMSRREGGRLKRHESHQVGRDVDVGFYFKDGPGRGLALGTASNLDLPRNWALVRALVARTDVESILLDTRLQKVLYRYATSIAEDKGWLDQVFGFVRGSRSAIIKHFPGHKNHYHVRFFSPVAQELGRRAQPLLVQLQLLDPPVRLVRHVVRPGETIGQIAARYDTTVQAIMRANGLRNERLRARRGYRVPVRGAFPSPQPLVIRHRLLPPDTPSLLASIEWPTEQSLYGEAPLEH
jgi:penicillin-insensitive murein endopeptidase